MNLYEISAEYKSSIAKISDLDLPEDVIADTLEAMTGDFDNKAIALVSYFKNLEVDAKAIKEAEQAMANRRKSIESHIKRLKEYLLVNMQSTGITAVDCPYFSIKLQNNPKAVNIINEALIPTEYVTEVVTLKINKAAIKAAGGCDGVELIAGQRVVIK